uniref:Putative LOC101234561 [Hydra vulgaris] n=1 Tax=Lepeophtheirus salmonis TaxID=72036 RepID=A0A0K2VIC1_LEPSM
MSVRIERTLFSTKDGQCFRNVVLKVVPKDLDIIMGFKCCAPGCKQGYNNSVKDPDVSFHRFPLKDPKAMIKWLKAMPKETKNKKPTNNSRLCSLHFSKTSFITASTDETRNKGETLKYRRLQDDAIPSSWPNLESHISSPRPSSKPKQLPSRAKRLRVKYRRKKALENIRDNKVQSAQELYDKLLSESWPSGFSLLKFPKVALVKILPNTNGLNIAASLEIEDDLSFKIFYNHAQLNNSSVSYLLNSEYKVQSVNEAINIAVFLGSKDQLSKKEVFNNICKQMLQFFNSAEMDLAESSKLSFVMEQMSLLFRESKGRQYSPGLLSVALMWQNVSHSLYDQIYSSNILTLPSTRYLKILSSAITVEEGLPQSTIRYLKSRIRGLKSREKYVTLMIDEIYSAQRVEFVGGKFFRHENDTGTKTILTFMIKSAASKYTDVIALVPVTNLTPEFLFNKYNPIMKTLWEIGFTVVALSIDNHSANRTFYAQYLCGQKLQNSIAHPHDNTKRVFLLIDAVHNFKNIYNCFQSKDYLVCPNISLPESPSLRPNFAHIREIFNKESTLGVKLAHKLSIKVLNANTIEKTNVKLADAVFHESTIAALKFYSDTKPEYMETANFIEFVRNHWNIMNINTPYFEHKKKDIFREPISKVNIMAVGFLREFAVFLEEWKKSGSRGLTEETFLVTKHTSLTVADLSEYLLKTGEFDYVLTAMFQSDPLEKIFSWYRQLCGGNYFISGRKILEGEKKIRASSLVKFSNMDFSQIKELLGDDDISNSEIILTDWKPCELEKITSTGESSALYFVAGYIAFSLQIKIQCTSCRRCLALKDTPPDNVIRFETESDKEKIELARLIEIMSRGGLSTPSDILYLTSVYASSLFDYIFDNEEEKTYLMKSPNPRALFVATFMERMAESSDIVVEAMMNTTCDRGHKWASLLNKITQVLFNIMNKNIIVKRKNNISVQSRKRLSNKQVMNNRKIKKLQSVSK